MEVRRFGFGFEGDGGSEVEGEGSAGAGGSSYRQTDMLNWDEWIGRGIGVGVGDWDDDVTNVFDDFLAFFIPCPSSTQF